MKIKDHEIFKEIDIEKTNELYPYEKWSNFTHGSHKKVWWKCDKSKCGKHKWIYPIHYRIRTDGKKSNCPYCSKKPKVCPCKCNSFGKIYPELLKEWDYEKNNKSPYKYTKSSNKKVWWKCNKSKCGEHKWKVSIYDRIRTDNKKSNCPYCSKSSSVCPCKCNSVGKLYPELLKEWDYEKNEKSPYEYTRGSNKKVWWKCNKSKCGEHKWITSISKKTRDKSSNCPYCTYCSRHKKVCLCGCNSFGILYPKLLKEYHSDNKLNPFQILPYYKEKKIKWICEKNHIWETSLPARTRNNNSNCPLCSYGTASKLQIEWLKIKKIVDNTFINHYGNSGEIKIKYDYNNSKYTKVDGYSKKLNKIYEFHGDFWHGNPKIYNKDDINCFSKKTYYELYKNTIKRTKYLKNKGYIVEELWEYDWKLRNKLLKDIRKLKKQN